MVRGSEELRIHFGTLDVKFGTKKGSKKSKRTYVLNKESELAQKLREQGHWVIQN
jgi:hypothetical protein